MSTEETIGIDSHGEEPTNSFEASAFRVSDSHSSPSRARTDGLSQGVVPDSEQLFAEREPKAILELSAAQSGIHLPDCRYVSRLGNRAPRRPRPVLGYVNFVVPQIMCSTSELDAPGGSDAVPGPTNMHPLLAGYPAYYDDSDDGLDFAADDGLNAGSGT